MIATPGFSIPAKMGSWQIHLKYQRFTFVGMEAQTAAVKLVARGCSDMLPAAACRRAAVENRSIFTGTRSSKSPVNLRVMGSMSRRLTIVVQPSLMMHAKVGQSRAFERATVGKPSLAITSFVSFSACEGTTDCRKRRSED